MHFGRVGDVAVVGYSAVFLVEEVVVVEISLKLIAVAYVGAEESPSEIFGRLVGVEALGVDIVEGGTHLNGFVHIA